MIMTVIVLMLITFPWLALFVVVKRVERLEDDIRVLKARLPWPRDVWRTKPYNPQP